MYFELKALVDSIINDTPLSVTGEDSLRVL